MESDSEDEGETLKKPKSKARLNFQLYYFEVPDFDISEIENESQANVIEASNDKSQKSTQRRIRQKVSNHQSLIFRYITNFDTFLNYSTLLIIL